MLNNKRSSVWIAFFMLLSIGIHLPAQKTKTLTQSQILPPLRNESSGGDVLSRGYTRNPLPAGQARITSLSPTLIGRSPNWVGSDSPMNNAVYANDSTGAVVFIHRNDPAVNGGSVGGLRYDLSTDAGLSWNSNIGLLNPSYLTARYPQVAGYDALGNTSPLAGRAIFHASHLNISYSGIVAGSTELVTSGTPASQELLLNSTPNTPIGGMAEGLHGEYWSARLQSSSGNIEDSLSIYKGTYNTGSQSIAWALHTVKIMPWSGDFDGQAYALGTSVAFSPDGSIGWIATLGDLDVGLDTTYAPILLKSTDGGATWGNPVEINLNSFPWVHDSLRALWVDTFGNPISTGRATTGFHYDLTVDANGNPHLFFVIGSASDGITLPSYAIYADLSKYAVDLTSTNQGTNFELHLVAPILTFRGIYGSGNGTPQDNYPQVSRTQDGQYIFYSWVDSDTAVFTGSQMGVGFGESVNLAPNLWVSGKRIADGFFTCIQPVTIGDLVWDGNVLGPQMAPEVLRSGSGPNSSYNLPIVMAQMLFNDPAQPIAHHYFGNDVVLTESDFAFAPGSSVFWLGCALNPTMAANIQGKVFADYNGNGILDGTDFGMPNMGVSTSGITYSDFTDINGNFDLACAPGYTYGLSTGGLNPLVWTPTLPVSPYTVTLPSAGSIVNNKNFGFQPIPNALDLAVQVVAPSMRPGFTTQGAIYVENFGPVASTGTLTLAYDPLVTLVSATPPFASNNTSTHQATWNLPQIDPFGTAAITLDWSLSASATLGSSLNFIAHVATSGTDMVPTNNTDMINVIVIGSYDPNDKTAAPAGQGVNHEVQYGSSIAYRIRFQNTGSASAINIIVRDTLSTDMDVSTLRILGGSHPYSFHTESGRFLIWEFNNINLPDSFSNEPASHGYIDFIVGPKPNLPFGTVVENSASIYFDFNAPVLTNTAWVTYEQLAIAKPENLPIPAIRIYPHPIADKAIVEFQRYDGMPWTFELYDLQGRLLRKEQGLLVDRFIFERSSLAPGTYVYKVTTVGKLPKTGKLVLE